MKISTQTEVLADTYDLETAVRMIARAGFDAVDLSLFNMAEGEESPFFRDDYAEYAQKIKALAKECGVYFNQAHAPFRMDMNAYLDGGAGRADVFRRLNRAIEVAGILGVRNIVVHPVHCISYANNDPDALLEINRDFYAQLIPAAQAARVKIAIENMWQRNQFNKQIISSTCSSPYELARYVDVCNELADCFVACLDIGHCALTGHDPVNCIHVLGNRLAALHVHDNDTLHDSHNCPQTMSIDCYPIMEALKSIGYEGELTLEADYFFKHYREDLYPVALQFMQQTARHLADVFEGK
ncbi:MAG: sugar phosphate isomerase/epimerase [Oscillospiraceae bacterium]|nr:sugar phosphate isomerase/epimerase [Oscillospiraceae bacterium]